MLSLSLQQSSNSACLLWLFMPWFALWKPWCIIVMVQGVKLWNKSFNIQWKFPSRRDVMKMSMRTSNLKIISQNWKVGLFPLVGDFLHSKNYSSSYTGPGLWSKASLWSWWRAKTITDIKQQNLFTVHTYPPQNSLFSTFCKFSRAWHWSYPLHTWQQLYYTFASVDSPSTFLTINSCSPWWITCANFSKSG